jgi:hypothetical protein
VLLEDLPAASLVAALLGARDSTVVAYGMQVRVGGEGAGGSAAHSSRSTASAPERCVSKGRPHLLAPARNRARVPPPPSPRSGRRWPRF